MFESCFFVFVKSPKCLRIPLNEKDVYQESFDKMNEQSVPVSLFSSCPEGCGHEEKAAALYWSVQISPQLSQPLFSPRCRHPLCSHQPGNQIITGATLFFSVCVTLLIIFYLCGEIKRMSLSINTVWLSIFPSFPLVLPPFFCFCRFLLISCSPGGQWWGCVQRLLLLCSLHPQHKSAGDAHRDHRFLQHAHAHPQAVEAPLQHFHSKYATADAKQHPLTLLEGMLPSTLCPPEGDG